VFGYDKIAIAANALLFSISHPLLAVLANWVLDKYGLKIGVNLSLFRLRLEF
jgi:hypothetical protein